MQAACDTDDTSRAFRLPDEPCPGRPAERARSVPMRILVVEDSVINQIVTRRLLERRGHEVSVVDSGPAALELLGREPFGCVLMDVELPGLSGPDTLARLRDAGTFGRAAATPVIALTAHGGIGCRESLLARGFDEYLAKPIDTGELDGVLVRAAGASARRA